LDRGSIPLRSTETRFGEVRSGFYLGLRERKTHEKGSTLKFHYQHPDGQTEAVLTLPLYAYPGYTLTANGEEKDYEAESYGRMILHTDVPDADVVVSCTGSPSWRLAYGISGVTVAVLVLYGILKGVKRHTSRTGSVSPAKAG